MALSLLIQAKGKHVSGKNILLLFRW